MKFGIRELFFVILLLAIPFGAYLWVFRPANEDIEKQRQEIQAKEVKLANLHKAMAGIKDLNQEVENLREAVAFFESKLPPRHEIHKVLKQENHMRCTKTYLVDYWHVVKTRCPAIIFVSRTRYIHSFHSA